jgi:uncharacterized protein
MRTHTSAIHLTYPHRSYKKARMSLPLVTLLVASFCALLQFGLAVCVVRRRRLGGVQFLHGDDDGLLRLTRAHGNLAENAPIVLLLLLMCELLGLPRSGLALAGSAFCVGRLLHVLGLLRPGWMLARVLGMALTLFVVFALAATGLWLAASRLF